VACGTRAAAGAASVAAPSAVLTQAGHASDRGVVVDLDSGDFDGLDQLPCQPPGPVAAHRGRRRGSEEAEMSPRVSSETMLRVPDVLDRVGVSRRTLGRWRADGTFPQALRLGANSIGWPRQVIDEWIANRPPAGL